MWATMRRWHHASETHAHTPPAAMAAAITPAARLAVRLGHVSPCGRPSSQSENQPIKTPSGYRTSEALVSQSTTTHRCLP